jgi:hypothetical protein
LLGNAPLKTQYPALYRTVRNKSDTIAVVLETNQQNVSFTRDLLGARLAAWHALLERLAHVQLSDDRDMFRWNLHFNRNFSVDSFYKALLQNDAPINAFKPLWKMRLPLRIKIFTWYLRRGVILTKDNLRKRNWHGSSKCCFCPFDKTIRHLFFQCRVARSIWSTIQIASNLYPPSSMPNIFGNWLHGIDKRDRIHIRVEAIALLCRYGCVEIM